MISTPRAPRETGETGTSGRAALPPAKETEPLSVVGRAYEDYCRLLEKGECPDTDAFCRQYPSAVQPALRCLVLAHSWAEKNRPESVVEVAAPAAPPVPAPPGPPAAWPKPGETFQGFHLQRRLGRGAFAHVFLATEPALGDRQVVVKVSWLGAGEAATQGRLSHRNIVPVYSARPDAASGLAVICMPYQGTATLHNVLERAFPGAGLPDRARVILEAARPVVAVAAPGGERQPPARLLRRGSYVEGVLHLGAQLADALAFIHGLGVCHQDLKPSNVLVRPDGRPMLLDFNLARDERAGRALVGGTVPYMAPEQLRFFLDREQPPPGARSDLFALGVILYELLTGQLPFGPVAAGRPEGELCQEMLERQPHGPRPLRTLNPRVDRALARLVERCLAWEPAERPGSAAELAAAFRRALTPPRRAVRWAARHPRLAAAGLVLALALATAGALGAARSRPAEDRPAPPSRSASSPAALAFEDGQRAYRSGQYEAAIQHFTRCLALDAEQADVWFARGRARQQRGDKDNLGLALEDYEQARRRYPAGTARAGQATACLAYCRGRLGQHGLARFLYERAREDGFAPAAVFNNLGYCYQRLAKFEQAGLALDRAIELDPGLPAAYHNQAVLAYKQAFLLLQQADLEKMTHAAPVGPRQPARLRLADCLRRGMADVRKAIALGPGNAEVYCNAARLCVLTADESPEQAPAWIAEGQGYLEEAVKFGADRRQLAWDSSLESLCSNPLYKTWRQGPRPAPIPPVPTSCLVDPLTRAEVR